MDWGFLVTAFSTSHTSPDRGDSQLLLFQPTPHLRRFLLYENARGLVRRNEHRPVESSDTDSPPPTASKLLLACHGQHATEPRDMVFALSGIFKSIDYRLVDLEPGKSAAEIYHEACVNVITGDNPLLLLEVVGGIRITKGAAIVGAGFLPAFRSLHTWYSGCLHCLGQLNPPHSPSRSEIQS